MRNPDSGRTIDAVRLEAYRRGGTDLDMAVNYLWNTALSEALYPTLQTLAVALRNTIHMNACNHFGKELRFDDRAGFPLEANEQKALDNAKRQLRRSKVPRP